jgi:hypothetical protein
MGGGLYREMSRLFGFRVLGFLGLLGYLIPYLGLLPFVTSIIPQVHPSKTIDMFFDKTNLPKNQEHQETPFTQDHLLFIPSRARRPTSRLQSHTTTWGDNAVYGILLPPNREGGAEP